MALYIQDGETRAVVDLAFVDGRPEVFGLSHGGIVVDLAVVEDRAAVYGVSLDFNVSVNLKFIENEGEVWGPLWIITPLRSFRRIQLNGGGRMLFESTIGDEAVERFFELWRHGRPHPLINVSNPVFTWRSPSGEEGHSIARVVDGRFGRIGCRLFVPDEAGTWLVQLRFVEEINFAQGRRSPRPPYAPGPGSQEHWRQLPRALRFVVREEGGWGS